MNFKGASNNTEKAAMLEKLVASLYIQKKPAFRIFDKSWILIKENMNQQSSSNK